MFPLTLTDPSGTPVALTDLTSFNLQLQVLTPEAWVQDTGVRTNQLGFNVFANSSTRLTVEVTTNLNNAVWVPLQTVTVPYPRKPVYFSDPEWTNYPARFYRVPPSQ